MQVRTSRETLQQQRALARRRRWLVAAVCVLGGAVLGHVLVFAPALERLALLEGRCTGAYQTLVRPHAAYTSRRIQALHGEHALPPFTDVPPWRFVEVGLLREVPELYVTWRGPPLDGDAWWLRGDGQPQHVDNRCGTAGAWWVLSGHWDVGIRSEPDIPKDPSGDVAAPDFLAFRHGVVSSTSGEGCCWDAQGMGACAGWHKALLDVLERHPEASDVARVVERCPMANMVRHVAPRDGESALQLATRAMGLENVEARRAAARTLPVRGAPLLARHAPNDGEYLVAGEVHAQREQGPRFQKRRHPPQTRRRQKCAARSRWTMCSHFHAGPA